MKVAFFGATKGMGRALARLMAGRGDSLVLLGRQLEDLQRSAADLAARGAASVGTTLCDLERPDGFAAALASADEQRGGVDTVVVTAGLFSTQAQLEHDLDLTRRVLTADFTNTVLFCERARAHLLARGGGRLCVFSSVAGERGRQPVILYGAAKAGLTRYLEALDHRYRSDGLITICVKPGFVHTSMTEGLPAPPFAGTPEQVAARVLKAIDTGTPVVYAPAPWALIMLIIRWLPRFVMRRIKF